MLRRIAARLRQSSRSRAPLRTALAVAGLIALALLTALATSGRVGSAAAADLPPLLPVADAHVRSDQADAKLGTLPILRVDPTPITRAYLRFDVQGLSGPPAKALLRLHAETSHADGYRVARVASLSWLESTITYNNAPPIDAATVGGSGPFSAGDWTEVDVTSLVSGNGLVSFGLVAAKETNVNSMNLSSRESGANAPQLLITSGPPTPDTTKPSVPGNVAASAISSSAIKVSWSASTDNVAVAGYRVYRDDAQTFDLGAGATSFTDTGLAPATAHGYQVDAVDTSTNRSARSAVASATTLADGALPPLLPVADAHVRSDQADAKLGTLPILRVDPTPITRAYLRFDVQGLSGPPAKAVLRLHAETSHADGYRVARVASLSWLESTITYNNAPPIDAATVGGSGPFSAGDWTEVDVTSLVSGNGLVSFGLVAAKETNVNSMNLSSRESGANAPQLLITSGPPTPDTTKPSVPGNVAASAISSSAIKVSWSASTDNVAVAGYRVYRDDAQTFDLGAGATSFTDTGLAPATAHGYQVDAVDTSTNRSARSGVASATTLAGGGGGDPVIGAAGDIACGSGYVGSYCLQMQTADQILQMNPAAVLALGDIQYEESAYADYVDSSSNVKIGYDKSWGRFKAKTYPAIGNHEYLTPIADNYLRYWSDYAAKRGPYASLNGFPEKGFYSFDLGAWHLISFNSNCNRVSCTLGSEQEKWIRADLAAHPAACTLAFAHHPFRNSFFETSHEPRWPDLFQLFYDKRVDLVLVGHAHSYERTAPMNPAGGIDRAAGVREFVVGTGGKGPQGASATPKPFSEAHAGGTLGVMKLTLHPTGYDWDMRGIASTPFVDMGAGSCH